MSRFLYILLSVWIVFASSCALKGITIQKLQGETQVEENHFPLGNLTHIDRIADECVVCMESDTQEYVKASTLSVEDLSNLDLSLLFTLFIPFWIVKPKKRIHSVTSSVGKSSKIPLYLRFRKIQLYV